MSRFQYIDEALWHRALMEPDWYLRLMKESRRLKKLAKRDSSGQTQKAIKEESYQLIEEALESGEIALATSGDDFDTERQPIDTIVIHHTKNQPGMTLERLNAMHLLRIYASYYAKPSQEERHLKGRAIWSGHFYQNRQVFWGYHWFVRQNGEAERILDDSYIGWQAGNWNINTRSIAICLDDDLTGKEPTSKAIQTIAKLIREYYPNVPEDRILGHRDVNADTACPGSLFHTSWRQKILDDFS